MKSWIAVLTLFSMLGTTLAGATDKADSKQQLARAREYLYHAGFRAIISSVVEKSFIYIESTEHGLVFRSCSVSEVDGGGKGGGKGGKAEQAGQDNGTADAGQIMDPSQCPTILNNEDIGIPPEMVLSQSLGLGRILWTAARVVLDGAVIFAVDLGTGLTFAKTVPFSIAAVSAKSYSSVHPENPITSLSELAHAQTVTKKILKYGDESDQLRDGQIITVLLTQRFPDIMNGVTMELLSVVKKIIKKDGPGSLGLQWECDYHKRMNALYNKQDVSADEANSPVDECATIKP